MSKESVCMKIDGKLRMKCECIGGVAVRFLGFIEVAPITHWLDGAGSVLLQGQE